MGHAWTLLRQGASTPEPRVRSRLSGDARTVMRELHRTTKADASSLVPTVRRGRAGVSAPHRREIHRLRGTFRFEWCGRLVAQ